MRDIPDFELGYVTNGAGKPVDDRAIAYSENFGIERELELQGEGASDLMPLIVQALNSYDQMTQALRLVRMSPGWSIMSDETRHLVIAALAKAEGA